MRSFTKVRLLGRGLTAVFLLALLLSFAPTAFGAPAAINVSGIVNTYAPVTNISGSVVTRGSTTGASTSFATGDYALLIQMTGRPPAHGGSFGRYELKQITAVSGANITLSSIDNSYEFSTEKVQIIRVPFDTDVNVTGQVTALAWNGTTGGVVALKGTNLNMSANIDATGKGFVAGTFNGTASAVSYTAGLHADTTTRSSLRVRSKTSLALRRQTTDDRSLLSSVVRCLWSANVQTCLRLDP